jgi:uncharacterized membrane protein YkvA (DUF1232 family)
VHYSDDNEDLVGRRRGGASPDRGNAPEGGEDLAGPRRGGAPRASSPGDGADAADRDLVGPRRGGRRSILDDEDDGPRPAPRRRRGGHGEAGLSREVLMGLVRDVPSFIKLFGRLATDPRVSKVDKAIVAAVVVYLVSPVDLVPDWVVPVVGQIEDVYLLALALSRLVNNAGVDVLMDHWQGNPASLETALEALDRAGSVLPGPVQALLGARR